jgi:hypothetical protein
MRTLAAAVLLSTALAAQNPPATWTVTHVAGPEGVPGQKLLLTVKRDQLSFASIHHSSRLSIPMGQITQVVYSPHRFTRDQQLVGGKYGSGTPSIPNMPGCGSPGCGGAAALFVVAWAISGTMHGSHHYVTVTWVERDVQQQMMFETSKSDRTALTEQLRQIAADRWIDVEVQRRKLEALIQEHEREAVALKLERDSECGGYALPKGEYRFLVQSSGAEADVYFFAGRVVFPQLRGIAHARAANMDDDGTLQYAPGSAQISSLPWRDKSLKFLQAQ